MKTTAFRPHKLKIAYIAPYQGADLLKHRPCSKNLMLAARVKIQLIAEILQASSHQMQIISQGAVDRTQLRFYPQMPEGEMFHPGIPVDYISALPIRFIRGFWEGRSARRLLKARHQRQPFDLVIIYGMGSAQVQCAEYAIEHGIPVVLEYEDDVFVDVHGNPGEGYGSKRPRSGLIWTRRCRIFERLLSQVSAVIAPSPYLLDQCPPHVPKLLVRSVVSEEILKFGQGGKALRKNWVVFSGTHEATQGLEQTVKAWRMLRMPEWELHIAGKGPLTQVLEKLAHGDPTIQFHGFLNREENARLICAAKIGMNPQDITKVPGSVFAFKICEYLAAGLHVMTTPRGSLEPELEAGVTYIKDNSAETIAACLDDLIRNRRYDKGAQEAAIQTFGMAPLSKALNGLLAQLKDPAKEDAAKECQPA